jgi:gas vesicle protein
MNTPTNEGRDYRLALGLLAGTAIGAGLVLWFAPKAAAELRGRLTDSAKDLGQRASDRYQDASARVGEVVGDLTRKGQDVRDNVADTVARSAHEVARGARGVARAAGDVESFAVAAKSDRS